jgi:thiol-disulfide isomerase/thioredoxin
VSFVNVLGVVALGFVGLVVLMQVWLRLRVRRITGKPLPSLPGRTGEHISAAPHALIYFFSPSCAACRAITPVVRALPGQGKTVFAVDVMQDLPLAQAFQVMATPSAVEVEKGVIVGYHVGPIPPAVLERFAR